MSPLIWRIFALISVPGLADPVQILGPAGGVCARLLVPCLSFHKMQWITPGDAALHV